MTKEILENIFNPFYTTKPGGTGVGLAVTQQIIDEHEGQLKANSKVGKGTTFSVYLLLPCDEEKPDSVDVP
jgi:signal transduction histidine kinase